MNIYRKTLPHIIFAFVVVFIVTYFAWNSHAKAFDEGSQTIYFNPYSFSGFLGTLVVPLISGIIGPFIISLIFIPINKNAARIVFIVLLYIGLIFNIIGTIGNETDNTRGYTDSNEESSYFEPSQKETELNERVNQDHYDEKTKIYSNYYAGFSMMFPYEWEIDKGFSEHTVVRWVNEDSAFTFSINIIKLNVVGGHEKFWENYELDKKEFELSMLEGIKQQVNSDINEYKSSIIWFANHRAIFSEFSFMLKHFSMEYPMKCVLIQIPKDRSIYTMFLQLPLDYYIEDTNKFDNIFEGFYFGYAKR